MSLKTVLSSRNFLFLIITFVLLLQSSSGQESGKKLKILGLFFHPGKSHFDVFKPLLEELGTRGHELTVVSYFPRSNTSTPMPNYRDIDLRTPSGIFVEVVDLKMIEHSMLTPIMEFFMLRQWALETCQKSLANSHVKDLLKTNVKYDLIITEVFNCDCFLGFVHHFKAPFISLSSHDLMPWANDRIASDANTAYMPSLFTKYSPNMNFLERLTNTVLENSLIYAYDFFYNRPMRQLVTDTFGKDLPPINDIAKDVSAILLNTHYSLNGARPNVPGIVEVGGLHIVENKDPLPRDIQEFLDGAKDGAVFFSWGSMIKATSMTNQTLGEILKVLGSIQRRVIWKWENEDLPGKPDNVMVKKWLPQAAILRHPNVKCYLAHGGLLGLSEGVSAGVPLVIVPFFGDQFHNAASAEARGVAVVLEWAKFNAKTLRGALDKVLNDPTYMTNAKALQKAWHDRPATALETSVWWAEYVARGNGNKFLKPYSIRLNWFQRHRLDVFGVLVLITIFIIYVIRKALTVIINQIFSPTRTKLTENGTYSSKKLN